MDIRSKNIRYSLITKAAAVFLLWLSFTGLFTTTFYYSYFFDELNSSSYYNTNRFFNEFTVCINNVFDNGILHEDIKSIKTDSDFKYIIKYPDTEANFLTNLKDGGKMNLQGAVKALEKQPYHLHFSQNGMEPSLQDKFGYYNFMENEFKNRRYELYVAAQEPFQKGGVFYWSHYTYDMVHELKTFFIVLPIISGLLLIASFIYLLAVAGRKEKGGRVEFCFIDRIYTDVQTLLVIIAASLSLGYVRGFSGPSENPYILGLCAIALLSVDMFIGLTYVLSMARHRKNRSLLRSTLVYTIGRALVNLVSRCIVAKTFRVSMILLLLLYGILSSFFFMWIGKSHDSNIVIALLLWLALNICAVWFTSKVMLSLSDIMKWVNRVSEGGLEDMPETEGRSPVLKSFANDLRNIQSGLKNAVAEAVKGERLKTELITNVSHDLKTPLTSIINYVDLLKREETENINVKEYTGILAEKANRLKQQIDDLLEASKAASGNISANFEAVDLHALALQASAEFNDKAAEAGLELRVKPVEKAIVIHADGSLMWRILENLFSNVLKYSQRNSRVYLDIEDSGKYGVITIKNMSGQPLDIPAEQLMERFVRGDRSRTTEGSGLGLAIARSLAEIQEGRLDIKIDGDLFKASVMIPLEKR